MNLLQILLNEARLKRKGRKLLDVLTAADQYIKIQKFPDFLNDSFLHNNCRIQFLENSKNTIQIEKKTKNNHELNELSFQLEYRRITKD